MEERLRKLDAFFNPHSVAVIGATKKTDKAGYVIFKNFSTNKLRGVFNGELYPVNPNEDSILGLKCYRSLSEIPGELDLIVIVIPALAVPGVMEEAANKKVKACIIITAGFREVGNADLEDQVVAIAKSGGTRVLGPNCLGIYYSKTGVDTLFLPETKTLTTGDEVVATPRPMPGSIAMITQSGAFGSAALDYLTGRQMGVSKFVSFGNKCDVNESDILLYLLKDQETKVVLAYLEDVKDGREFLEVAKKVTVEKPVVALKTGRSSQGARAAASHTGAIAGSDKIYDAAFQQGGIIRAEDMEEFFDMGKALAMQPPAMGTNIGILTDAGGPGVMTVDECEYLGLTVGPFSDSTIKKFQELKDKNLILKISATSNPVDLTGSVTDDQFVTSADLMFQDAEIDGIILLGLHHMPGLREKYIDGVVNVSLKYTKPIVMCDIGETEMALYTRSRFDRLCVPSYSSPEAAARAMKALVTYGEYLKKAGFAQERIAAAKKECAFTVQP
ncbi:MAG TPA: CoA-binding protein [Candidatus Limnocylindrales bacterium]|nr:CoA-binding protein [Candidatus Limnocylindrales bacterium]